MRGFQLSLGYIHNKSALFKTILLLKVLLFCLVNLNAQAESNIKFKIEAGMLWDWVDKQIYLSGSLLGVEPKLKTSKNTFIGLFIGAAKNTQRILTLDPKQFFINNDFDSDTRNANRVFSFVPTVDYYFIKDKIRPYLGVGVGYYFLTTSKDVLVIGNSANEFLELSVNNKIGLLLRGGLDLHNVEVGRSDLSKFAIGLVFHYVPKADVKMTDGQTIGTVITSNIALSFGYTFGNSKRLK